jgi:hypothetical protein
VSLLDKMKSLRSKFAAMFAGFVVVLIGNVLPENPT